MNKTIKRAVITGSTGMIGMALTQYLLGLDISVTVLIRPNSPKRDQLPKSDKITILEVDLSNLSSIEAFKDTNDPIDAFFHLGWGGTFGEARDDMYVQNLNIKYTLDAVHLAHRLGCQVFVGTGSQAEYGRVEGKLQDSTPTFPENGYGIAKLCAGQMSRIECKKLGIRHEWVRILSVYGPKDGYDTMIMTGIKELLKGERPVFSEGEQLWDYLYVKDAARALYLIALKGRDGAIYPLGSGQARPLKEYMLLLASTIDPKALIGIGEVPYREKQVMYLCADISQLTKDTGFLPEITFEEGIKETVNWCRMGV
ncbi:MAG: NAD(P)-dependent oxidoreductase [Clostridiales bacterium]|mgnify:CR=1 FL=1|nr:NAD(P)-dependent oxidoreductase [Clostridiales bacterium]